MSLLVLYGCAFIVKNVQRRIAKRLCTLADCNPRLRQETRLRREIYSHEAS